MGANTTKTLFLIFCVTKLYKNIIIKKIVSQNDRFASLHFMRLFNQDNRIFLSGDIFVPISLKHSPDSVAIRKFLGLYSFFILIPFSVCVVD